MSPAIEALGSIPLAVMAAVLLLAAAFGAGKLLIKLPVAGRGQFVDVVLLRTTVGLNLIGVAGVALGQLKLLAGGHSIWLLAAFSLLNLPEIWRWLSSRADQHCAIQLAGMSWSITAPYRGAGWPAFYRDLPYSGFPSLGEILFWLVAPLESVIAPRLINWMFWIIGLLLLYRLLQRIFLVIPL